MNNTKPKLIFDKNQLANYERRAGKIIRQKNHLPFLHMRACEEMKQRLSEINYKFNQGLLIAPDYVFNKFENYKKIARFADLPDMGEGKFDIIISMFDLPYREDVKQYLLKIKAMLKNDGFFICVFLGGESLTELRQSITQAEEEIYQRISPHIHPMIRIDQGAFLLQTAGFAMPVADRDIVNIRYKRLESLYVDLLEMAERNALIARVKTPVSKKLFVKTRQIYKKNHFENSHFKARFELVWLSGWKPDKNQPKPLKRGSATTRLADILGVKEIKG